MQYSNISHLRPPKLTVWQKQSRKRVSKCTPAPPKQQWDDCLPRHPPCKPRAPPAPSKHLAAARFEHRETMSMLKCGYLPD